MIDRRHRGGCRNDQAMRAEDVIVATIEAAPTTRLCAPGGTRTPNLLIRSQTLCPLSYGRWSREREPLPECSGSLWTPTAVDLET